MRYRILFLLIVYLCIFFVYGTMTRTKSDFSEDEGPAGAGAAGEFGETVMRRIDSKTTAFCLDWDDTFLPLTYLKEKIFKETGQDFVKLVMDKSVNFQTTPAFIFFADVIRQIQPRVIILIQKVLELGEVYIVTNAKLTWFKKTLKLMSELALFIERINNEKLTKKIHVISTSGNILAYPVRPKVRKLQAVHSILKKLNDKIQITNLISIGDSDDERQMVHFIRCSCSNLITKSVKFNYHNPSIEVFINQLELLKTEIENIATSRVSSDYVYKSGSSDSEFAFDNNEILEPENIIEFVIPGHKAKKSDSILTTYEESFHPAIGVIRLVYGKVKVQEVAHFKR